MGETARAISLAITGPIRRCDLEGLSQRVCGFFSRCIGSTVVCDVAGVPADVVTVDALSRLQWVAHKYGCTVVLRNERPDLRQLVELMGLTAVLPSADMDAGS